MNTVGLRPFVLAALVVGISVLAPAEAHAYGGPGSFITGLGALLALVAALVAAIFGFLWFPIKRFYRRIRARAEDDGRETPP